MLRKPAGSAAAACVARSRLAATIRFFISSLPIRLHRSEDSSLHTRTRPRTGFRSFANRFWSITDAMTPSLPLPVLSALLLGFLLAVLLLRPDRPLFLAALVGFCAIQAVVIALAQHYGIAIFALLQPITAAAIPPLAWAAFQFSAVRRTRLPHDLVHLTGPVLALAAMPILPKLLDALIPALFLCYGGAILLATWRGADALPLLPFAAGDTPGLIWKVISLSLMISGLGDVLISAVVLGGKADWQPWIVAIWSSLTLLAVGGLVTVRSLGQGERCPTPNIPSAPLDPEADRLLMARLDALLECHRLYLDPELTLTRLARKLHVPVKQLSAAINWSTGGNVSRHVNAYRIREACRLLKGGSSVTNAMLASGFNTKSNFNREFRRVTGRTPSGWRDAEAEVERRV